MAERRMIAKTISISEQVAALRDDFTRLLFTWLIAHADDYGVVTGAPAKVRALVVPLLEHVTLAQVKDALADMERQQLIYRYSDHDGAPLIQFVTWEKHQFGLHKRTAPKHKLHDAPQENPGITEHDTVSPTDSGKFREVPGSSGSRARARGTRHRRRRETELEGETESLSSEHSLTSKYGDGDDEKAAQATPETDIAYQRFIRDVLDTFNIHTTTPATLKAWSQSLHEFYCRSPDRTRGEAVKAAEWLASPENKKQKRLSITFLRNWLDRAFAPPSTALSTPLSTPQTESTDDGTAQRRAEERERAAQAAIDASINRSNDRLERISALVSEYSNRAVS